MSEFISNLFEGAVIHENTISNTYLNTPELTEGLMRASFKMGEWEMRQWQLEGIGMKYFDVRSQVSFAANHQHDYDVVHLHFNLSGRSSIFNHLYQGADTFGNMQHNMNYANGFNGITQYDDGSNKTFFIQFTKEAFLKLTQNTSEKLMRFGEKVLEGKASKISESNGLIDVQMHNIINSIINCQYSGGIKKIFFLSKCFEMLVLQADAFEQQENKKFIYLKTEYDKERILYAREYLLSHIDNPPTIPELSKIAGVNEFKLKKGFKEVFGNTIFAYLTDYKLEMARNQLQEGMKTATELSMELGYSSLQHFSKAYKNKFGNSPLKS